MASRNTARWAPVVATRSLTRARAAAARSYGGVYRAFDCLLPWTVGRFSDPAGAAAYYAGRWRADAAACRAEGRGLAPVVWPGLSEGHLHRRPAGRNAVPRRGGLFLWEQCRRAALEGAEWLYVAMFDEVRPQGPGRRADRGRAGVRGIGRRR